MHHYRHQIAAAGCLLILALAGCSSSKSATTTTTSVAPATSTSTSTPVSTPSTSVDSVTQQQLAQLESDARAYLADHTDYTKYDPTTEGTNAVDFLFVGADVPTTITGGISTVSWHAGDTVIFAARGTTACFYSVVNTSGAATRSATSGTGRCDAGSAPGAGTWAAPGMVNSTGTTTDSVAQQELGQLESAARAYLADHTDYTGYDPTTGATKEPNFVFVAHNVNSKLPGNAGAAIPVSWLNSKTSVTFAATGKGNCYYTSVSQAGTVTRGSTLNLTNSGRCSADTASDGKS